MLKSVESAVTAFALMTVICTFGLSVVIAAAGVTKTKLPYACNSCAVATASLVLPRV